MDEFTEYCNYSKPWKKEGRYNKNAGPLSRSEFRNGIAHFAYGITL